MSGLILNLKPWETFLVGESILQNGGKRGQLRVRDQKTGVLRLSDALHPDDVQTPLTRAYSAAQLLLLKQGTDQISPSFLVALLEEARTALAYTDVLDKALRYAFEGEYYKVLRVLKPHLPTEVSILRRVQSSQG